MSSQSNHISSTTNNGSMAYRKWSDCPPRALLGRADALLGSHDHLILLLARIADFTVRDRARKIRQNKADGGWRPRPGMPGFGPPSSRTSGQPSAPSKPMGPPPHMKAPTGWSGPPQTAPLDGPETRGQIRSQGPSGASMPNFYGMAPTKPPAPLTAGYRNTNHKDEPPAHQIQDAEITDLAAAYESALVDWNNITAAHATVAHILASTESFASLPDDLCPPLPGQPRDGNMTPFGPALIHRSYDISIIWTMLHMAKIILIRCHPAMPPAMHMAAGICAQATQPYAMLIGRITAGMQIPLGDSLSPFLGAALVESTMSLFFAGIQFQDAKQREWLVTRLLEIDRRSGWASAGVIARSCETAWEKAANAGAPPYTRRTRRFGEKGPLVLDEDDTSNQAGRWHNQQYAGRDDGSEDENEHGSRRVQEEKEEEGKTTDEIRYVVKRRQPWAMNLLGTEEDLRANLERMGL